MILIYLVGIIVGCTILAKATNKIVRNIEKFSKTSGLSRFALTSVLVATATSLPELSVSVTGAINNSTHLAYGNAVGSNMANLSLIIGLTALWGKGIRFSQSLNFAEVFEPLGLTFIPFLLMIDKNISRIDGVIMIMVYIIYTLRLIRKAEENKNERDEYQNGKGKLMVMTGWWVLVLIAGAEMVVRLSIAAAESTGVSQLFIGLFLVSVGTSLPELIFNIGAIKNTTKKWQWETLSDHV